MKTSDITCCVVDKGLFLHLAIRLARDYKRVMYWSPWESAFPSCHQSVIGDGFKEIERVESIWEVKDECDLFVFPDVGYGPLQRELRGQGYPVWGHMGGDELELYRGKFMDVLKDVGLPEPTFEKITGITALRDHLRNVTDKYIKVSLYRGDFETFHFRSWEEDRVEIDVWSVRFGAIGEQVIFYVFDPIDTEIEDGMDSYCIDGQWPTVAFHGMECKDKFLIGTVVNIEEIPEEVTLVNDKIGPVLGEYGYRGFFSTEVRITKDKESYFIDPTCRCASPPSQVMGELYENLGEIIWNGAHGVCIDPEPTAKFGVQGMLNVSGEKTDWKSFDLPDELERWVKPSFACKVDSALCFPPQEHDSLCGWLTATGDTILGAIEAFRELQKALPDGVTVDDSGIPKLLEEIKEAEKMGMEFTDQKVPEPQEAV